MSPKTIADSKKTEIVQGSRRNPPCMDLSNPPCSLCSSLWVSPSTFPLFLQGEWS